MEITYRAIGIIHSPFSIVELKKVRGNVLDVAGVDVMDGTPLLDIKPYVRQFDCREGARSGWVDERDTSPGKAGQYSPGGRAGSDRACGGRASVEPSDNFCD